MASRGRTVQELIEAVWDLIADIRIITMIVDRSQNNPNPNLNFGDFGATILNMYRRLGKFSGK